MSVCRICGYELLKYENMCPACYTLRIPYLNTERLARVDRLGKGKVKCRNCAECNCKKGKKQ